MTGLSFLYQTASNLFHFFGFLMTILTMLEAIKIVRIVSVLEYMNLIAHDIIINNIKVGEVTDTFVANNIRM